MVDREKLNEQLRKLKKQIRDDPQVRALYDLDGDGNISGEEWEKARRSVIAFMKATGGNRSAASGKGAAAMGVAGAAGAADAVFQEIKGGRKASFQEQMSTLLTEPHVVVKQQVEGIEPIRSYTISKWFWARATYEFCSLAIGDRLLIG